MPEYLDIVDENDNVIGKDTRENIHKRHLVHRGIHVFVVDSRGEILIQKRSRNRKYYPRFYDASVGAQVRSGESYEEAAIRETQEELGFTPEKLQKICDYKSYSSRQRENRRLFVCQHSGPFRYKKDETNLVEFMSVDQIRGMIKAGEKFTEGFKISFGYFNTVSLGR